MQIIVRHFFLKIEKIEHRLINGLLLNFLKRIYFGLLYFFIWAGSISLHDEMFGSTSKVCSQLQSIGCYDHNDNIQVVSSETETCPPFIIQFIYNRHTEEHISDMVQQIFVKRNYLMAAKGECPERHRERLRFCSG